MTPQFLRHEAARFRGMAEDADREATKARLLAMAADYEARAGVANEMGEQNADAMSGEGSEPDLGGESAPLDDTNVVGTVTNRPGVKIATGSKETVMVQRRPVGRPRKI